MSDLSKEPIELVWQEEDRAWFAMLKRMRGVHAFADTPAAALAMLLDILPAVGECTPDRWASAPYDDDQPCGGIGCGCCEPGWKSRTRSGTLTFDGAKTQTIVADIASGKSDAR